MDVPLMESCNLARKNAKIRLNQACGCNAQAKSQVWWPFPAFAKAFAMAAMAKGK